MKKDLSGTRRRQERGAARRAERRASAPQKQAPSSSAFSVGRDGGIERNFARSEGNASQGMRRGPLANTISKQEQYEGIRDGRLVETFGPASSKGMPVSSRGGIGGLIKSVSLGHKLAGALGAPTPADLIQQGSGQGSGAAAGVPSDLDYLRKQLEAEQQQLPGAPAPRPMGINPSGEVVPQLAPVAAAAGYGGNVVSTPLPPQGGLQAAPQPMMAPQAPVYAGAGGLAMQPPVGGLQGVPAPPVAQGDPNVNAQRIQALQQQMPIYAQPQQLG